MKDEHKMPRTRTQRKTISREVEADVLIKCRRRCCLCYFWDGNSIQQPGQIAHIDRDPSNDSLDNLAYLCFSHHNLYDSSQLQGKNITADELRHARNQLHRAFNPKLDFVVTLRLNCDDDDDAASRVEDLMQLLKDVTLSDQIELLNVRRGSLLVTVRLGADQTRRVFEAIDSAAFDAVDLIDATIDHVDEGGLPQSDTQLSDAVSSLRERTAVLESTLTSLATDVKSLVEASRQNRALTIRLKRLENKADVLEHHVQEIVGDMHPPASAGEQAGFYRPENPR